MGGIFGRIFLGGFFWEEFFVTNSLGGILWEELHSRNYKGIDVFVKILG